LLIVAVTVMNGPETTPSTTIDARTMPVSTSEITAISTTQVTTLHSPTEASLMLW